ncbi:MULTISPECIES: AAA family ATPase [Stenotrophomonas maltophilia group]|uniref:AAA family ATPase n=1 Tax=Stenotrophomonas maltophilia group TaxID=995085 RepID=UPI0015DE504D|nr:AAA family ATPase [Stenotrophomonas maltophilia]MDZ5814304.1 AAA family ATPase [Stenotrophomonas maltophilia]
MKINIGNFGPIKGDAEIEPGRLTVISGANNTGKTYLMYVLWALYQRRVTYVFDFSNGLANELAAKNTLRIDFVEFFSEHWGVIQRGITEGLKRNLYDIFSAPAGAFSGASISVKFDKDKFVDFAGRSSSYKKRMESGATGLDVRFHREKGILWLSISMLSASTFPKALLAEILSALVMEMVIGAYARGAFLLPAERSGLNLFYPDLDAKSSAILRHLKRDANNPFELIKDMMVAQYAEPIDAYLSFLRQAPRITRKPGEMHVEALRLQKDLARVRYKVSKDGVISVKPYRAKTDLGIHLASSTVKSFYGLWAWLEGAAKAGDCVMIDEPELNLHPDNQRLVARLLVRLVNIGMRVVISTHSDYIVREISNMIMLSQDFPERRSLEKKFGYNQDGAERMSPDLVAAYAFSDNGVERSEVSAGFGIEVVGLDRSINSLNESNSSIYFAVSECINPFSDAKAVDVSGEKV